MGLRHKQDDSPFLPGSSSSVGEGKHLVHTGRRAANYESQPYYSKNICKSKAAWGPSDIPLRQDKLPYKKLVMSEGPKPSSSVKESDHA